MFSGESVGEIERAARLVQRHAVEQHLVVAGFAAAHEQRRQVADAARSHRNHARHRSQQIDGAQRIALLDLRAVKHRDRRADLRLGISLAGGRDDD